MVQKVNRSSLLSLRGDTLLMYNARIGGVPTNIPVNLVVGGGWVITGAAGTLLVIYITSFLVGSSVVRVMVPEVVSEFWSEVVSILFLFVVITVVTFEVVLDFVGQSVLA